MTTVGETKHKILELLNQNEELRFTKICEQADPKTTNGNARSVRMTSYLKGLVNDGLITQKYVKRQSWYQLTGEGKTLCQKE